MLILMMPVFALFYWMFYSDTLVRRIIGILFYADLFFIAYSIIEYDGERLLRSFLYAIPITVVVYYGIIKFLDLGIKFCDYILKKTS
ncbi:hypothetical protein B0187_05410 [Haemophilus paracuniculus]|uniref:Uncharacterized protein n=1 Tax=Haemophilus paracuniculus TaxID=734 RepID=A0A1T0AS28_9PAST|nr:hypothetical protein B0187_05410 [Haemophilus paracuniculus]